MGRGLGLGPRQPEKALGAGLGRTSFKHGAGPLLRTCAEGERQHMKGGPLECGVPEFGGRVLSESVWVGFRPFV